jgi:hypothetical protein
MTPQRLLIPLALAGALVAGCGSSSSSTSSAGAAKAAAPKAPEHSPAGDIPDNQAYVAYRPPAGGFSVRVPEGWARTSRGGAVTFTDKLNAIRMESMPARRQLTAAEAARGTPGAKVSTVTRPAGRVVRIAYLAKGRPDPVTGKARTNAVERYVFFRSGQRVALTLSGPKGADNVDPWKIVTDSLRYTR